MGSSTHTTTPRASWSGPAIGLLDLDAFFASVEQLDHPAWRGKPVIVGGDAGSRGVVSTASYEARPYGVHSAMPSAQARRLCPDAIWTCGHFDRYRAVSHRVMALIERETPLIEQVSIDEAFFDVSPGRYANESPIAICQRIQASVAKLGVTCSIGLGANKTVAKVASEREKPRGLCVIPPSMTAEFLAPLPIRAMSGIGPRTAERLRGMGIDTLGQLAAADVEAMRRTFGSMGPKLVLRASGRETSTVPPATHHEDAKSVSNERTFAHDLEGRDAVEAAIDHVGSLVGRRLRAQGIVGSVVTLKLKTDYAHGHTAQQRLVEPTDDEHEFCAVARRLLDRVWAEGEPVRLVGVGMSRLSAPTQTQLSLFGERDAPEAESRRLREQRRSLSAVEDEIRARFGRDSLSMGLDLRLKSSGTLPSSMRGKG